MIKPGNNRNYRRTLDLEKSHGSSIQILTSVLRIGFNETSLGQRPNGKGYGFPSGHVAAVMSGATFLGELYGWKWGPQRKT